MPCTLMPAKVNVVKTESRALVLNLIISSSSSKLFNGTLKLQCNFQEYDLDQTFLHIDRKNQLAIAI